MITPRSVIAPPTRYSTSAFPHLSIVPSFFRPRTDFMYIISLPAPQLGRPSVQPSTFDTLMYIFNSLAPFT